MTPVAALAIAAAGFAAGTINTIVGSGSLITFPTLLALGYPPVVANVSNTVGLVPGVVSGTIGYRRELAGQAVLLRPLLAVAAVGGLLGGVLLLTLDPAVFQAVVPVLISLAVVLVLVQPRLARRLASRRVEGRHPPAVLLPLGVFVTAVYGGYFGAAQGVLLIAILGILVADGLQRLNAVKNVLAGVVNGVAAVLFIATTHVDWAVAGLIAAGSVVGGQVGARVGRRLPGMALRVVIAVVGVVAVTRLLLG